MEFYLKTYKKRYWELKVQIIAKKKKKEENLEYNNTAICIEMYI